MAEFCKQCADDLGFPRSDFLYPNLLPGQYMTVLCEGCGSTQVNSKGECICSDCIKPGHNAPLDKGAKFYVTVVNESLFHFKGVQTLEVGFGEWSHTIPEQAIKIFSIDDINGNIGDFIYVCSEGTYILYEIVSESFLKGFDAAIMYNISGDPTLEEAIEKIPEECKEDFKLGWDRHFIKIT